MLNRTLDAATNAGSWTGRWHERWTLQQKMVHRMQDTAQDTAPWELDSTLERTVQIEQDAGLCTARGRLHSKLDRMLYRVSSAQCTIHRDRQGPVNHCSDKHFVSSIQHPAASNEKYPPDDGRWIGRWT